MALKLQPRWQLARLLAAALIAAVGSTGVLAEKPDWAGGGKSGPPGQMKKSDARGDGPRVERPRRDRDDDRRAQRERRERDRIHRDGRDRRGPVVTIAPGSYFNDGQRRHAHQWYGERYRAGRCPPGLAKKNNGCLPPGQAKKWAIGQVLPAGVVYYPVPQAVAVQIGLPPAGYRYVRVANDILLLAIGSRMVIDAITDLGHVL